MFTTHAAIIEAIGVAPLAEALDIPASHIRTMKARNSIPVRHWFKTVMAAEAAHLEGVSIELLAKIAGTPEEAAEPSQEASAA